MVFLDRQAGQIRPGEASHYHHRQLGKSWPLTKPGYTDIRIWKPRQAGYIHFFLSLLRIPRLFAVAGPSVVKSTRPEIAPSSWVILLPNVVLLDCGDPALFPSTQFPILPSIPGN